MYIYCNTVLYIWFPFPILYCICVTKCVPKIRIFMKKKKPICKNLANRNATHLQKKSHIAMKMESQL